MTYMNGTAPKAPMMPPKLSHLTFRARTMGYETPEVEIGDVEDQHGNAVPVVRVTLRGSALFHDVESMCQIGTAYRDGDRLVELRPDEAEYLATRSALAEALVLAMDPAARR